MSKLRPCPMCGGKAEYRSTHMIRAPWSNVGLDVMGVTVVCKTCGCTIPSSMGFSEAEKRWNRRAK